MPMRYQRFPLATPLLAALAGALGASAPALADTRSLYDADGRLCERAENVDTLMARFQWYVDTYGENGVFDPQRKLEATREAYAEYLREKRARREPLALSPGAFRFLGPLNGAGRTPAVELHPSNPSIVYVGAAGGGCWKTTDGGDTWRALTDGLADLAVGAVAIAPSSPEIVYLGTGEGAYSTSAAPGIGIFRSTDGGETWIPPEVVVAPLTYKLSVDPRNASTLLAFTNQGVQRSTDGGITFSRRSNPSWGDATDVARDPTNPDVLHATFWGFSGGETARYARSTDAGVSWTDVRTGLPPDPKRRMSIAISSDGRTLYSLIASTASITSGASSQEGLFRSTDGGTTWKKASLQNTANGQVPDILSGQGGYDNCVAVDPDDARVVLLGGGALGHWRSTNSGDSVTRVGQADNVHVDVHQLVFKRYGSLKVVWSANDGGVWRSTDGGVRWLNRNAGLGTRQYYAVALDPTRRDVYYAGTQDNGTDRRGNDTTQFVFATGGDGFDTVVDPLSPSTVYTTSQFSTIWRSTSDGASNGFGYISGPLAGAAFSRDGGDGVKPFFTRLALDPEDPRTLYTGTYRPWRTEDRGATWTALGTGTFLPSGLEIRGIAVAKSRRSRLLVAQRTRLFRSDDAGATWVPLDLAPSGLFFNVEIDPTNPDVFWASSAFFAPSHPGSVYRSTDAGATWTVRTSGLPSFAVPVVRVDPTDSAMVYAGTLVGLYRSTNSGATWTRFGEALPAVAVLDLRFAPDGSRLVVATHGRGLWAADVGAGGVDNRPPEVAISAPASVTIAAGTKVFLHGTATDPDGDAIARLQWDLGDGMTATGTDAVATYRTPGTYRVSLVADDAKGARGAAFTTLVVAAPNDACANAQHVPLLPGVTVDVRTGNAGTLGQDPLDPANCSDPEIWGSIWFEMTAPADGTLDLDAYGSLGDTVMALYGGSCADPGAALACNDDGPGTPGGASDLPPVNVTAGRTYRVFVASWASVSKGYSGPVESIRMRALFTPASGDVPRGGATSILPVVLDAAGQNGARFQSDLALLNSGTEPLVVALTYGGQLQSGGATTTSLTLEPGSQTTVPDAISELRRAGIGVPRATPSASQVGSLTALVTEGDPASLVMASRVATPNPNAAVGGTFGLFATDARVADAADAEPVFVYGLRQTELDRANLALVHVPSATASGAAEAPITLRVEVFGADGAAAPSPLSVTLQPGEWRQLDAVLAQAGLPGGDGGGYARVSRTAGSGRFVVYGVVNDQRTADGSLVAMAKGGRLRADGTLLVPVVLEAAGLGGSFFTSELVVASRSARSGTVTLRYEGSPLFGAVVRGSATLPIAAGGQLVLANVVELLRQNGVAIPRGVAQGGALFVTFQGLEPADDVYAGARTGTPNPDRTQGGSFGVFVPGVDAASLATSSSVVPALRRDSTVRANLAAVNAGGSPITLSVRLRSPLDGAPIGNALENVLQPGEWTQWSNVFHLAGAEDGEAWAVVTRTSGDAPFYAYGVLNDQKTSDGSVVGGLAR